MAKHSKGPWRFVGEGIVMDADDNEIDLSRLFDEPDARVIAAAPAMREALEACNGAFANWQIGQIPGRPEDILALITKVRAALVTAES